MKGWVGEEKEREKCLLYLGIQENSRQWGFKEPIPQIQLFLNTHRCLPFLTCTSVSSTRTSFSQVHLICRHGKHHIYRVPIISRFSAQFLFVCFFVLTVLHYHMQGF